MCVDTTWGAERGMHWFNDPRQRDWLQQAFTGEGVTWRVPFCHHPAYCAGPHHDGQVEQVEALFPLYRGADVRLMLHGHEHNFQHGCVDGLHYVVSGAGGKLDERTPTRLDEAGTVSWAAATALPAGPGDRGPSDHQSLRRHPARRTATSATPAPHRRPDH